MLTANQQQLCQVWPFLFDQPLMLVDWLPWNHTFGSNHNFNMVLRHAGTLVIDGGRPLPAMVGETVRNLTEISPTIYFNVPAGYAVLLPFLETRRGLRAVLLRASSVSSSTRAQRCRRICGTASKPLAVRAHRPPHPHVLLAGAPPRPRRSRPPRISCWTARETIGLPVPGVDMKLVPTGGKLEVRVRGPDITPGYWKRPDLTRDAFDDEGFYKPGDAVRFADPADAAKGILFDGRLAEDFKLTTGTWVQVGALRVGALTACSPVLQDAIVAGADREFVGLLCWLNAAGCQKLIGARRASNARRTRAAPRRARARSPQPDAMERRASRIVGARSRARSCSAMRPSIDANEITDKGYINQRLALERRAADVSAPIRRARRTSDVIVV